MDKEIKKAKIIIKMVNYYLKVNIWLEKLGKGKRYYDNGNLKFEGEYLHGKNWIGKGYDYSQHEVFEIRYGNRRVR